ncbi:6-phosphogluconate dehydrogenase family protein [Melia azedarach]|uniref:6-phosphogluconate dehydrogenase family protein n=1 Tax=Melia azedarach TaxID=155640 RepID=A0ACC1Y000_MELAZ|nr:6-phosphogluconate dehydrogenase family protein [Melia azedarach]
METPYPSPISPSKTRVGWIGIGLMGSPMASRLLSAGYPLTVYARNPSKALRLQSQGALLANSPRELAQSCDVVFTIIGGPPDVRAVVLGPDGILSGLNPGGVTVDMTTSQSSLAQEIFKAACSKDCWSVDAPVSGADVGAREGKLAILAGGNCGVVEWLSPLFKIMGKHTYMGEAGCGQICKTGNQIVGSANLIGMSEAFTFAERAGLDLKKLLAAMKGGAAESKIMQLFGEKMIERDFMPGGFAEYLVKDFGIGLNVVEEEEAERVAALPGAALCKQLFSGMIGNGDGKLGLQGVITVTERINGINK